MRFNEVLELWLNEKQNYVKQSTYAYYCFEVKNYIEPLLGAVNIEEIDEEKIQTAVLYWQKCGMSNGRPLRKSTVQNLIVLLKQILKFAYRKKIIKNTVIEIYFVSQTSIEKQKTFSYSEQQRLICALLQNLDFKTFGILLCLNTGLRIGEVCALQWKDFDITEGVIHVRKTLQRIYLKNNTPKTEIIISTPKTESSVRDIPLNKRLISIINTFNHTNGENYILTNTQAYIEPKSYRNYYTSFLKKNSITPLNFHCLRHTFATCLIENGADYKSVSEILGHSTINMTLNMYVHPKMEKKRKCIELIPWN